ncbi:MAG: (2Fe-2S) ferredoxin domain-containing protein [Clostridia bacterium]
MKLLVCVGSSCHLKGSYDVITKMQELIKKYDVEDKIELAASFCLGNCATGVTMKADEIFLHHVNAENVEDVFLKEVYPRVIDN